MSSLEALFCGADVGASATKLVLLDNAGDLLSRVVRPSGIDYAATARACLAEALDIAGRPAATLRRTVSTGYGRRNVDFADDSLTEIHCHGIGCFHLVPEVSTIVDIGGQDNKIIRLDSSGRRIDFQMNRKCAAGTGAFLEEIAIRLGLELGELDALASSGRSAVRLSSFCTVFAKTEILAHLRDGAAVADIVRGAFQSVVNRVTEMAQLTGTVVLSGGVIAHNPTIARILEESIGRRVEIAPIPQFTGALGAALAARRQSADPAA